MATTDLKLEDSGSLHPPGPIGRVVRIALGLLVLHYVSDLSGQDGLMTAPGHIRPIVFNGILPGLVLVSYVINIGFSRDWKKWPAVLSVLLLGGVALFGYVAEGTVETSVFAQIVFVWEVYVFLHLGAAFLLAGLIATPGCEMRAFHHLYSKVIGQQTKEHICPIGPLSAIDAWEARLKIGR